ncbi:amidohydrolase family protein [Rhabdothermincola salaria]|uniref:amidohydrolase family protein n=1 Tax=Rhabdothermincola salaria TaxID=2903142 RepID=UPI001E3D9BEC|nr:amidohydrolase [Rhabdothermincola salaria]
MSSSPTQPAPSSTQTFADDDPYLIIAADSHAGLPTEQYRQYLESRYHPQFDEFLAQRHEQLEAATRMGVRDEKYAKKWFEDHDEELAGGWDAIKRDQALDNDGVAAEVVYPDADAVESRTCVPFGAGLGLSGDLDPELGMAGAKAHNRWLAELCSHSPERRKGVALVPITVETEKVIAEIQWAHDNGLGAVMIPAMWVDQTPYHDRSYDPIWALCEELRMPVVTHSGSASRDEYGDHLGIYVTEVTWWPARPLWFLLWSGVFHRFPGLRFGVTEGGCWWLPGLLWSWDRLLLGSRGASKLSQGPFQAALGDMLPSEIVDRNCFTGLANVKRRELGQRYEIGIDNMLWGTDFPHPEGTWPNTHDWLQKTFFDIPVEESRRMLGLAAADTFGFDLASLRPISDKVGPTPTDLGQLRDGQTAADLTEKWAPVKEVGRHWLTGHDFPLLPGMQS